MTTVNDLMKKGKRLQQELAELTIRETNTSSPEEEQEFKRMESKQDNINPDHYKVGGIETIEYMKAKASPDEFHGHLRLTALKYLSRYGHKDNTLQELKKAKWYLDRLIQELE